jgi:DNA-binding NarL/FixJ family response regulator
MLLHSNVAPSDTNRDSRGQRCKPLSTMTPVRVFLADDHEAVLHATAALLGPKFEIVGTAGDGPSLVDGALRLKPDLLIVDISMPILNGIEAIRQLRQAGSTAKVVFLTVHDDPDFAQAAIAIGAGGYVVKPRMASDLIPAIQEVLAGRSFVSPTLAAEM